MAPLLSRATHPERVRRTSESASRQLQCRSVLSARVSRATAAPLLRRFASARSRLRRRRSHPSILEERCWWDVRSRRTCPPPSRRLQIASHCSTRRGNRRAGRPGDDLVRPSRAHARPSRSWTSRSHRNRSEGTGRRYRQTGNRETTAASLGREQVLLTRACLLIRFTGCSSSGCLV